MACDGELELLLPILLRCTRGIESRPVDSALLRLLGKLQLEVIVLRCAYLPSSSTVSIWLSYTILHQRFQQITSSQRLPRLRVVVVTSS